MLILCYKRKLLTEICLKVVHFLINGFLLDQRIAETLNISKKKVTNATEVQNIPKMI